MTNKSRETFQWKLKASLMLLLSLIATVMFSMNAFAGDTDIGTGYDMDVGAGSRDWGINYWTSGYRMYMEGPGGSVVQPVLDVCFSDPSQYVYAQCGRTTNIGNKSRVTCIQYKNIESYIPGLKPPYYDYAAWGPELDAWFESEQNANVQDLTNAGAVIAYVFGKNGGDVDDLLSNYNMGNYRIVVEAVYWWRPVSWQGTTLKNSWNGKPTWIYGNIQQLADFDQTEFLSLLSEDSIPGGGPHIGNYTNGTLALAICLDDTDTGFSGWNAPQQQPTNTSGDGTREGGPFTYSQIMQPGQGYGMHIIYREKAEEKWYTYQSPSGATGGPEDAAPEMPDIPGIQTGGKFRPVTIVKYYEERTVQQDGKTKSDWKTVSGPYSRPSVCRSIVIIYFE